MNHVAVFAALDVDRTLLDSEALVMMMTDTLGSFGVGPDEAKRAYDEIVAQDGASLPLLDYFERTFGNEVTDRLVAEILSDVRNNPDYGSRLMYDGASERIVRELGKQGVAYTLLTFGEVRSQRFKLDIINTVLGENPPRAVITNQPRKAEWLEGAMVERGNGLELPIELTVEPILTDVVVIVDDKRVNLSSSTERIRGILIDNGAPDRSTAWLADELEAGRPLEAIAENY